MTHAIAVLLALPAFYAALAYAPRPVGILLMALFCVAFWWVVGGALAQQVEHVER